MCEPSPPDDPLDDSQSSGDEAATAIENFCGLEFAIRRRSQLENHPEENPFTKSSFWLH